MKKTQELMTKIQQTKEPKERQKLLNQHMEAMHDMMQMMKQKDGGMMMEGGMAANKEGAGDMKGMMMCGEMMGMGKRMEMMQMMMEQMIERESAKSAKP